MKKKIVPILLSLVFMLSSIMTVFAADAVIQDGLSAKLTSVKTSYAANENIDIKLTIENTDKKTATGITSKITLPDGLTLKSGSLTQDAFDLEAGKSKSNDAVMIKNVETKGYTVPKTGIGSQLPLWAALMAISGAALAVIIIKYKKGKEIISLFLCTAVVGAIAMPETVKAEDKSFTVTEDLTIDGKKVTVSAEVKYGYVAYNDVTVTNGTGTGSYAAGDIVTITANETLADSTFADWTVESGEATLVDAGKTMTTFTMPATPVTVKANYKANQHVLTIKNRTGKTTENHVAGDVVNLVADAAPEHWHFNEWSADSGTLADASSSTTTFTMPASDAKVIANYAANEYTLTLTASEGGTISPSGTVKLQYGNTQHYKLQADSGYHISKILIGGEPLIPDGKVTSSEADYRQLTDTDESVRVEYAKDQYLLRVEDGTISVDGKTLSSPTYIEWGTSVTLTMNDPEHSLWMSEDIDVEDVGSNSVITFIMPKKNVLVRAATES
jgi:hypothetical protein